MSALGIFRATSVSAATAAIGIGPFFGGTAKNDDIELKATG
jgi:hypothetical protein